MDQHLGESVVRGEFPPDQPSAMDHYLVVLGPIMRGIAASFGRNCEVILHDLRHPEHSIVAIEGNVTDRHIGGSVTQIGLALIAEGDAAQDRLNYITRAPNGRVVKSSTIVLRDREDQVIGLLCINCDITDLRLVANTIGELAGLGLGLGSEPPSIAFVDDIDKVIQAVIDEEEVALGRSIDRMTKQDRLAIFQALDRRGVFSLQRSVPHVAEYLRISRATAYSYLEEIRSADEAKETARSVLGPVGPAAR